MLSDPVNNDLILLLGAESAYDGGRDLTSLDTALHHLYLVDTEMATTTILSFPFQVS